MSCFGHVSNHSHDVNGGPHAYFTQNSKQAEVAYCDLLIVNTTHAPFRVLISQLGGHGYTTDPKGKFIVILKALDVSYTP
jgi:hypothetical protein